MDFVISSLPRTTGGSGGDGSTVAPPSSTSGPETGSAVGAMVGARLGAGGACGGAGTD